MALKTALIEQFVKRKGVEDEFRMPEYFVPNAVQNFGGRVFRELGKRLFDFRLQSIQCRLLDAFSELLSGVDLIRCDMLAPADECGLRFGWSI
jgi:hypothetical protein